LVITIFELRTGLWSSSEKFRFKSRFRTELQQHQSKVNLVKLAGEIIPKEKFAGTKASKICQ
jgi:hypothetical protein